MKRKNLVVVLILILILLGLGFIVPLTSPRLTSDCPTAKTHFAILRGQKSEFDKLYSSRGEALRQMPELGCNENFQFKEAKLYLL